MIPYTFGLCFSVELAVALLESCTYILAYMRTSYDEVVSAFINTDIIPLVTKSNRRDNVGQRKVVATLLPTITS